MSISGISGSNFFQSLYTPHSRQSTFAQQFQQLGQDLQAGNLSQAQSDFTALTANSPIAQTTQSTATNTAPSTSANTTSSGPANSIAQAFTQLSQDLQAGNLTAAQSDFANIQQDFQQQASAVANHPHHHHHHGGEGGAQSSNSSTTSAAGDTTTAATTGSSSNADSLDQTILQLGQTLQAGNLQTAQQSGRYKHQLGRGLAHPGYQQLPAS